MNKLELNLNELTFTRDELISLCESAVVPYQNWNNRDSYASQVNLQEIYGMLHTGCDFTTTVNHDTILIEFKNITKNHLEHRHDRFLNIDSIDDYFEEFGYDNEMFDSNGWSYCISQNSFENDFLDSIEIYKGTLTGYIPTQKRLDEVDGEDWY